MGKGGGGGGTQQTTATTYQSNLPEYAEPYFKEIMARTQRESITPYQAYSGNRVAGFEPLQKQVQTEVAGMGTTSGIAAAQKGLADVSTALTGSSYAPTTYTPGYQAGTFDAATAAKYMSPYMQNVLDVQKREAGKEYAGERAAQAARAVKAGAFGGGREGAERGAMASEYLDRLADIEATGMQTAYQQAAQQFGAEQALQQTEAQQRLATEQATEASKQFGAQFEQQKQQAQLQVAQAQENLASTQQTLDTARINLQNAVGAEQKAQAQTQLDQAYQDFVNARDYERQQIAFYNAVMRGIPVPVQQEVIQSSPTAGLGTQLAGAGLTALGAFGNMG